LDQYIDALQYSLAFPPSPGADHVPFVRHQLFPKRPPDFQRILLRACPCGRYGAEGVGMLRRPHAKRGDGGVLQLPFADLWLPEKRVRR